MRVYVYSEALLAQAGFGGASRSGLRFPGGSYEPVEDPLCADAILCPIALMSIPHIADLERLTHYRGSMKDRHFFFECSDHPDDSERAMGRFLYVGEPAGFIRCNVRKWMLDAAPNTIPWPWPVGKPDLDAVAEWHEFTYDVGFHAWLSSEDRKAAFRSLQGCGKLRCDIAGYPDFYGYGTFDKTTGQPTGETLRRRLAFVESMRRSRLQVCPWSIRGVYPYRAFETMCAGRVAVIFVDGEVRPWTGLNDINWDAFCFHFPGSEAARAGEICAEIVRTHSDAKLAEMGAKAREKFVAMLDDRRWPELHREAVELSLRKRGMLQ